MSAPGNRTDDRGQDLTDVILRACHDLRTPLRAVLAHVELLAKDKAKGGLDIERVEQRLGFIIDGARKADKVVDGLAELAIALQADSGAFQMTPMEVMLRIALSKLSRELSECQAEVTYDALPRVMGNGDRLVKVFEHLIRNAVQHRGEAAPRIHVSAEREGEEWRFTVRDNGPGVEEAYRERVFVPFEKLKSNGVGLGLAICKAIVEGHGGKIWMGEGSVVFTLRGE